MRRVAGGFAPGILYGLLTFLAAAGLEQANHTMLAPRYGTLPAALLAAMGQVVLFLIAARIAVALLPARADWATRSGMMLMAMFVALLGDIVQTVLMAYGGHPVPRPPRGLLEQMVSLPPMALEVALPFLLRRG